MNMRWFRPYLLAILAVFVALQALWFIQPYISLSPILFTFLVAVMVTAWHGGFHPALFATAMAAVIIDYYFMVPIRSFLPGIADFATLAFFSCVATAMAYAIDYLQRARQDAAKRVLEAQCQEEELRRAVEDLEAMQRGLITELADTEDRERRHLASELHDSLAQLLALSQLKLKLAERFIGHSPGKSVQYIHETSEAITLSLTYTRTLIAEICPAELYDSGLPAAMQCLAGQMSKHGLTVELNLPTDPLTLAPDRATFLYRSIRELLMNVVKHAIVDRAMVSMHVDSSQILIIRVQDKGGGFDTSSITGTKKGTHFGLANVRERITMMGGWCRVESAIGFGTTITLGFPLSPEMEADSLRAACAPQQDRVKARPKHLPTQENLPLSTE
jgi:signal transduction histidine kinase